MTRIWIAIGVALYLFANFVAALAPLFVVQGRGAIDALADALRESLRKGALFGGIAAANATIRTVVAMVVSGVTVLLLPLSRYLPSWLIFGLAGLLTVVYCAASDVLLVGRTMAYGLALHVEGKEDGAKVESALYSAPSDLRS